MADKIIPTPSDMINSNTSGMIPSITCHVTGTFKTIATNTTTGKDNRNIKKFDITLDNG